MNVAIGRMNALPTCLRILTVQVFSRERTQLALMLLTQIYFDHLHAPSNTVDVLKQGSIMQAKHVILQSP